MEIKKIVSSNHISFIGIKQIYSGNDLLFGKFTLLKNHFGLVFVSIGESNFKRIHYDIIENILYCDDDLEIGLVDLVKEFLENNLEAIQYAINSK